MDPKQPEKKKRGEWYIIVGGVLGMLLAGYMLSPAVRNGDRVSTVPMPHPTPSAMPVPTATVAPSLTRYRWLRATLPHLDIVTDVSRTLADLFGSPLYGNTPWTALVDAQVVRLREADAALRGIVPPEECREAHKMLLSSTGDYLLGAEYSLKGFRQIDHDLIERGAEYVESAAAKMKLYRLMIEPLTP